MPPVTAEVQTGKETEVESEKIESEVSTSSPSPGVPPSPARAPFKFNAPSHDIRPKLTLVPGVEPKELPDSVEPLEIPEPVFSKQSSKSASEDEPKIVLPLQMVLSQVPAFQLNGSPMLVPEDVRIAFPLKLIEPQLASGRVMIPPKVFQRAIPELHRDLFLIDPNETAVALPLQEIVKRLPSTALRMRDDQEELLLKEKFSTPFSIQADEDAKRFNAMAKAVEETAITAQEKPSKQKSVIETKSPEAPTPKAEKKLKTSPPRPIQANADEGQSESAQLNAKKAAAKARELPGVAGCTINFADGLGLAGDIGAELATEGISAVVGSLLGRIDIYVSDSNLGQLMAMTLHCADQALTFFRHGNICLTALHLNGEDLTRETRAQLSQLTQELSQTYAQAELSHVDH